MSLPVGDQNSDISNSITAFASSFLGNQTVIYSQTRKFESEESTTEVSTERKRPPTNGICIARGKTGSRACFSEKMSHYSDAQDIELATAVASAAFAIHSNKEPKLQNRKGTRESIPIPRTKSLQDMTTGRPNKETRNNDELSRKKSMDQRELPSSYPNRASSSRPSTPGNGYQNQRGSSVGRNVVETKPDAWEGAQMKKIQKRYEKVKATIVAWENEKKMQAKAKMERRKNEIEQRRARNMQHYQIKQARIDQIAGGARAQAEEKRRNEESKVKEKAKRIRSTGKAPATCFCFTCN